MIRPMRALLFLVLVLLMSGESVSYAVEKAPSFTLPEWGTKKQVSLDDFRGKIVVLDFFNASCLECFRSSWELQVDIQEFYTARSGNHYGIEVQVVAVNSEFTEPGEMSAFLEETELDLVLGDCDGNLLQRYGGSTVPYLVVIDATASANNIMIPRVVYRSGYEGSKKLRDVIDAIIGQEESNHAIQSEAIPELCSSLPAEDVNQQITHKTSLDVSTLVASDVFVTDTFVEYHQKRPSMEFALAISYRHIDMDYESEYLDNNQERNQVENESPADYPHEAQ